MTAEEYSKEKEKEAGCGTEFTTHELAKAFHAGMLEMKQQMMKDAVECDIAVAYDNSYGGYTQLVDSKIPLATFGYKVKLIIIKED